MRPIIGSLPTSAVLLSLTGLLLFSAPGPVLAAKLPTTGEVVVRSLNTPLAMQSVATGPIAPGPVSVEAEMVLPYPPEQVWPVIANPLLTTRNERKVKRVRILSRQGQTQNVDYTVDFHTLLPRFRYVLRLEAQPESTLRFRRISGSFKSFDGSWRLLPVDGGRKTRVTYTLKVDPGMFIPRPLIQQAISNDLPGMMQGVAAVVAQQNTVANRVTPASKN